MNANRVMLRRVRLSACGLIMLAVLGVARMRIAVAENMGCCVLSDGSCTTATQSVCNALGGTLQGVGSQICDIDRGCIAGVGCARCVGGLNDGLLCEDAGGCPGGECVASVTMSLPNIDIRPVAILLERVGTAPDSTPLFNVTPRIEVSGEGDLTGLEWDIDYELFIDDVSVGVMSGMHRVNFPDLCDDEFPDCSDACSIEVIHGATSTQHAGLCDPETYIVPIPDQDPIVVEICDCTAESEMWPLESVPIGIGAECRLVVDPANTVFESDEENNSLIVRGSGHPIPTVSQWGLIIMTLLLLTAGTIVFGRRRRQSESLPDAG